jgi:ZIP family zinc transporter
MSAAIWWGVLASATLFLGQALARPLARSPHITGLIMGFGAGTLLSAIAYELVPESNFTNATMDAVKIAIWVLMGALAYYAGDRLLEGRGGSDRRRIRPSAESSSGMAMFLGALLDGIPEAFILGLGLAVGGSISWAFLAAVALSNIPQGTAGTTGLKAAGVSERRIFAMWAALTAACGLASGFGFWIADIAPNAGFGAKAFAAGALLMMLADSMIPEAYEHGGRAVGLLTVLGFLCAAALSVAQ